MPTRTVTIENHSDASFIRAKADAILWVKSAVARHGITLQQLEQAGCFASSGESGTKSAKSAKYIDASGHSWDGSGGVPEWLQRAINAGQSMDHFRIA